MRMIFIGDVVGSIGCQALRDKLHTIKKTYAADMVVVNGENSADGNGILPISANHIFDSGADVITGGNHSFRRPEITDYLNDNEFLLRPANFPDGVAGNGMCIVDKGRFTAAVINLMGVVYLQPLDCPFRTADRLIEKARSLGVDFIFVDIHAEATAEKKSLGYYLDGRVTGVFGTHTHVRTADAQILPQGTAYISDVGMTGPKDSVLGVCPELAIESLLKKTPVRFKNASGECIINGVSVECDRKTGKAISIESFEIVI